METVWVSRFFSYDFLSMLLICTALIIISVIVFIKKHGSRIILIRSICVLAFVFTLEFMVSTIYDTVDEWTFIQNNKQIIEGNIEKFSTGQNGSESFYIGEEYFCYPSSNNGFFAYDTPKRDNTSVIAGEGQYVRLTYYNFNGVNNICKIETRVNK